MSIRTSRATLAFAVLLVLAACAKQGNPELEWARAALQRNPNIELVATDERSGTFTVRDKQTGEVQAVSLQDLAAAPLSALTATARTRTAENTNATAAAPVSSPAPQAATEPAAQTAATEPRKEAVVREEPIQPEAQSSAASAAPSKPYTIERTDAGQLKISGPGISVVSAGAPGSGAEGQETPAADEPIICEGRRMLHLDGRTIRVDGDAITVRGGCELYITNSNIVASGTGVVVHDGTVHIANSYVEGANGSFAADSQAKVFVRGSTFQGLSRRDQLAMVQDQGGNRWR